MTTKKRLKEIIMMAKVCKELAGTDVFKLAKLFELHISFIDLQDSPGAIHGRDIYIKKDLTYKQKEVVFSHEVGHLVLGHLDYDVNFFDDEDPEKEFEANFFMANLLPDFANRLPHKGINQVDFTKYVRNAFKNY